MRGVISEFQNRQPQHTTAGDDEELYGYEAPEIGKQYSIVSRYAECMRKQGADWLTALSKLRHLIRG